MASISLRKVQILSPKRLKSLLDSIDCILFDCDGVLYKGEHVIEGTPAVITKLQTLGKKVFFVTNNATKTRREFMEKCKSMGFQITEDIIINSGYVASTYINELKTAGTWKVGKIFCLGSRGLVEQLEQAGLSVVKEEDNPPGKTVIEMATNYDLDPEVGCVLASLDESLTYLKTAKAARYLTKSDCLFAVTNPDSTLPVSNGIFLPDAGACVALLTAATGRKPDLVCGKPSSVVFKVAKKCFGVDPKRTLMVGDRLDTDIAFASACNLKSLLVLTGVSTIEDAKKTDYGHQPNFYLNSLTDMSSLLDSLIK